MLGPTSGTVIKQTIYNATNVPIQRGEVIIRAAKSGAYYKDFHTETKDYGTGNQVTGIALHARRSGTGEADKAEVMGVAAEDIPTEAYGEVIVYGATEAYVVDESTPIAAGTNLASSSVAGGLDAAGGTPNNVRALLLEAGNAGSGATTSLKRVFVNAFALAGALTA